MPKVQFKRAGLAYTGRSMHALERPANWPNCCDAHKAGHAGVDCGWLCGEKQPPVAGVDTIQQFVGVGNCDHCGELLLWDHTYPAIRSRSQPHNIRVFCDDTCREHYLCDNTTIQDRKEDVL